MKNDLDFWDFQLHIIFCQRTLELICRDSRLESRAATRDSQYEAHMAVISPWRISLTVFRLTYLSGCPIFLQDLFNDTLSKSLANKYE